MGIVRLKNGTEFEADSVVRGTLYPVLHIYTHSINMTRATEIFSDPESCREITYCFQEVQKQVIETENGNNIVDVLTDVEKVYHNFTQLYSVQISQLMQTPEGNEILIWLQRPMVDYD